MSDGKGDVWVEAGFAELARAGVEGVRVEVLAKNLGVTKGGFYRRFADRAALLDAMLEGWREGRIAAIAQQTSLDGQEPRERLKALIQLYSERLNPEGMAIELAIRQWARSDENAAGAVASVDAARLKHVSELYRTTGLAAEAAEAQAFLFYCFIFGQSLLFVESGARKRSQLVARSAEKLLD
ncbi:TetR/AcrR family transcriptional regulator [Bradyrhizobium diversitatis]|uniref:TetR/AcrR family transcriptional regulator n=1 Tax=Bradyrhizobium diversitatis TaxID=2755406 RepID=A0ABS0PFH8_9BRAD|nr:TetR/AcrR family transcriptional regulator [Bradyrhizobium diversitatis]KYK46070.1 TetR family transcriptional regulator [Bradyrhizobium liaoningense]MBH5391800.1 TetR/AcrR family transcriptional regulator [Bradyrhizobium diversitatis]